MESANEAERLLEKSDEETSREQLILTGLKPGMVAVDAGGGAGFVSRIMSEIVGPTGTVYLVDQSVDRLEAAKKHMHDRENVRYISSPLENISIDDSSVDYVFCRFVFEYLKDQPKVFSELSRLLKAGSKLVVGDLDHNCLSHFPIEPQVEANLMELVKKLEELKLWDSQAGRKLYSYFHGLKI